MNKTAQALHGYINIQFSEDK